MVMTPREQAEDKVIRRRMRRSSTQERQPDPQRGRFLRSAEWAVFDPEGHGWLFPQPAKTLCQNEHFQKTRRGGVEPLPKTLAAVENVAVPRCCRIG